MKNLVLQLAQNIETKQCNIETDVSILKSFRKTFPLLYLAKVYYISQAH